MPSLMELLHVMPLHMQKCTGHRSSATALFSATISMTIVSGLISLAAALQANILYQISPKRCIVNVFKNSKTTVSLVAGRSRKMSKHLSISPAQIGHFSHGLQLKRNSITTSKSMTKK